MLHRLLSLRTKCVLVTAVVLLGWPATPAQAQACTPQNAGNIGGIVFNDANGDGVRQAAEVGINGVVLSITGPGGTSLLVTSGGVSAIPGQYAAGMLCEAGAYTVTIVSVPAGYAVSGASSKNVTLMRDPGGVLSKVGNLNFALTLAPCTSSIGDRVWEDRNADGIQDAGEPGIAGVTVNLYDGATLVATTTTDANGDYTFVVTCSRTYRVEAATPSGFAPSPVLQGGDRNVDSDGSPTDVTVGADEHRTDVDFGFYALCQGVIGDLVWHDANRNGIQDAGEPGLYNVRIELVQNGMVVRTTFTDVNGRYEFTAVCPGTYQVRFDPVTVPAGFVPTLLGQGNTANDSNPTPSTVVLDAFDSSDLTIDFGFQVPCSGVLGDFVWDDANANGIQDAGEAGLAGVQVLLFRQGESMPAQVTVTSATGFYQFTGLCGGNFVVEVNPTTLPAGSSWLASPANQGSDDAADSDGIAHRAGASLPTDNASNLTIDFGYYKAAPAISLVKLTNGTDNNTPTGPQVAIGSLVIWTYVVTNTGNVPLTDVTVTDDKLAGVVCVVPFLAPGASATCAASGTAVSGQYANLGTAIGTPPSGPNVTASDPDHYFGAPPPPTGVCEGGVSKLVVEYVGTNPLTGVVGGQRRNPSRSAILAGQVSVSGAQTLYTFAITSMGGQFNAVGNGRLANNFKLFIGNREIVDFHTSCSAPIYPGMLLGPAADRFRIVEVWSVGGGNIGPM